MKIRKIIEYIEYLAPPAIAWERDNPGLQVGSLDIELNGICLALDINPDVLKFLLKKDINLIITHHPLIFKPLKNIDLNSQNGLIISELLKNNITLYAAHTNLDFVKNGVSITLAEKLQLNNIKFLETITDDQLKLVTFIPEKDADNLVNELSKAGAGIIGNYSNCSFRLKGKGTFLGNEKSNPTLGKKQQLEEVDEIRIEMVFNKHLKNKIIKTIYSHHPYEEPAFDIYPLVNASNNFGYGAFGELNSPLTKEKFFDHIKNNLQTDFFCYSDYKINEIKKVAVCGGSGKDLIQSAINNKCDAFITADINYHSYAEFGDKILLIDAGHYTTEVIILDKLKELLQNFLKENKNNQKIFLFKNKENLIKVYK